MHKPSSMRDYLIAILIAVSLLVFFAFYLFLRRGYLLDAPTTADLLYLPNKALAGVAMTLLAFTFLIGPIVRYFDRFDRWLSYRKEIGVVAAFFAVIHGLVSYYFLPLKFPQQWIEFSTWEFGAGLAGVIILVLLYILSFKGIIATLDGSLWWFLQRWGLRLAVLATLIHVYVMKWDGWFSWLTQGSGRVTPELANPWLPSLAILATLFITWVIIIRLYESIFLFRDYGFKTKEISMDQEIKSRGRRFFLISLTVLGILYLVVIVRWIGV